MEGSIGYQPLFVSCSCFFCWDMYRGSKMEGSISHQLFFVFCRFLFFCLFLVGTCIDAPKWKGTSVTNRCFVLFGMLVCFCVFWLGHISVLQNGREHLSPTV